MSGDWSSDVCSSDLFPSHDMEEQWNQVNPSCLLAYLGIRGFANIQGVNSKIASKNALPILAYYDIFKNYYANTQEENFYIIGNTENLIITINGTEINPNVIPSNEGRINNTGIITISPNTIKQNEVQLKVSKDSPIGQSVILAPEDIGTWKITGEAITITTNKVPVTIGTERLHLHGIVWGLGNGKKVTDNWKYGITFTGYFVNEKTICLSFSWRLTSKGSLNIFIN